MPHDGREHPGLDQMLGDYQRRFIRGPQAQSEQTTDALMDVFGVTAADKVSAPQYWGRHLGHCWERFVIEWMRIACLTDVHTPTCTAYDVGWKNFAVDAKYRIGSGDAKTLLGFRGNGERLSAAGMTPVMLVLRTDSLDAAISACRRGGWTVLEGADTFDWLNEQTGADPNEWLTHQAHRYTKVPEPV